MAKPLKVSAGPWKGVWDTPAVMRQRNDLASQAVNSYLKDGQWWARQGHVRQTTQLAFGAATRNGRAMAAVEVAGVWYNFIVMGSELYRSTDATGGSWTNVSSGQDFTHCTDLVAFNQQLVVTLDNARPFVATNLTAGTLTLTSIDLDSAGSNWVAYGPATVYAGRVFFILRNVTAGAYTGFYQDTIVWSEPATPLVGYRQTNFADFWQLSQSGQELLSAIRGTETALYYFRYNSIGVIYGKVDTQFVGEATQDSVSLTVGAASPRAVCQVGTDYIWFIDQTGHVWRLRIGDEPEAIWKSMAQRVTQLEKDLGSNLVPWMQGAQMTFDQRMGLVRVSLLQSTGASFGAASRGQEVFDALTGAYLGYWVIATDQSFALTPRQDGCWIENAGVLRDANGTPTYVMLGSAGGSATAYAYANLGWVWYEVPLGGSTVWDDDAGTARQFQTGVITHLLLDSDDEVMQIDRMYVKWGGRPGLSATFQFLYQTAGTANISNNFGPGGPSADDATGSEFGHGRVEVGFSSNCQGTWIRFGVVSFVSNGSAGHRILEQLGWRGNVVPALMNIR